MKLKRKNSRVKIIIFNKGANMKIIKEIKEMHNYIKKLKRRGYSIGFVPTMGFLHDGHLSLMKKASEENKKVIVSIFVNPLQFAPNEDFAQYPRDLNRDLKMIKGLKCVSCVFIPEKDEMYGSDFATSVELTNLMPKVLCGVTRPSHFKGVTTVVAKLLNIVKPDKLYLGQKDMQQAVILRKMINDLSYDTEVVICPIVREKDGLAMSSRNTYLSPEEREKAPVLYKSLQFAESMIELGERSSEIIIGEIKRKLKEAGVEIDYIEIVDADTLEKKEKIEGKVLIAGAIYIGKVRLIDNIIVNV